MEKNCSFKKLVVYALKWWIVLASLAAVGLAAGLVYGFVKNDKDDVSYTGSLVFSLNQEAMKQGEKDATFATLVSATIDNIVSRATDPALKSSLYAEYKDTLYPGMAEKDKRTEFFKALAVSRSGWRVSVSFTYTPDGEVTEETIKGVVERYLNLAINEVAEDVIITGDVATDGDNNKLANLTRGITVLDFDPELMGESGSPVTSGLIGLACGLLAFVLFVAIAYNADTRVKSIENFEDISAGTLAAGKDLAGENMVASAAAAVRNAAVKSVLLTSPTGDKAVNDFADKLCGFLTRSGLKARVARFTCDAEGFRKEENAAAGSATDIEIYVDDKGQAGTTAFLAGYAEGAITVFDQSKTKESAFVSSVNAVESGKSKYLGAIAYNLSRFWLDGGGGQWVYPLSANSCTHEQNGK